MAAFWPHLGPHSCIKHTMQSDDCLCELCSKGPTSSALNGEPQDPGSCQTVDNCTTVEQGFPPPATAFVVKSLTKCCDGHVMCLASGMLRAVVQ